MGGSFWPVFTGCLLLRQTTEYVPGDPDDGWIIAFQAVRPVRTAAGHDCTALRVRAKNGRSDSVFGEFVIPDTVARSPASRAGAKDDE